MNCANVCPKGLNPSAAISHITEELLYKRMGRMSKRDDAKQQESSDV